MKSLNISAEHLLYEGKAKRVYSIEQPDQVYLEFKDSLTAFNAQKKGSFDQKGSINRDIAAFIFEYLKQRGVQSHYCSSEGENGMVVQKVKIIPFEVVIRNTLAGSTAKKLGIEEGKILKKPLVEFYYKDDALADPFVSDDQILMMELATQTQIDKMKSLALSINSHLKELFQSIQIDLIDFKIEFGTNAKNEILLADEITPDCCRLWDQKTKEKLDKDRFRRDLGSVKESYMEVLNRLNNKRKSL